MEYDVVVAAPLAVGAAGKRIGAVVKSRWPETPVVEVGDSSTGDLDREPLTPGVEFRVFRPLRTEELKAILHEALARDTFGGSNHAARVAAYSLALADALDPNENRIDRRQLRLGCELHDVGKIGIPGPVLDKESRLSPEEFREVQKHTTIGRRLLEPLLDDQMVLHIVAWHHERWDGSGYPDGLAGEAIPLAARVVAIAEALDAMTSDRAYRRALGWDLASDQVRSLAGTQFDPAVVAAFERALPAVLELYQRRDALELTSP
jgi:HD-GYP domain-containing protein (c-di-GMP phosphodiesterase class II)